MEIINGFDPVAASSDRCKATGSGHRYILENEFSVNGLSYEQLKCKDCGEVSIAWGTSKSTLKQLLLDALDAIETVVSEYDARVPDATDVPGYDQSLGELRKYYYMYWAIEDGQYDLIFKD